jgi:hypothetical protein
MFWMKDSEVYVGFGKVKWFWSSIFAQDAVPDKKGIAQFNNCS